MQFDFVLFRFKKTFLRRKISLFSFETFVWNIFSYVYKTQLTRYSWKKLWHLFFRIIISKPTELNGDFIRFFSLSVAAKLCLSIIPKVDLYMQSSSFFRRLPKRAPQTGTVDPTFTVVVFGVFSLADFPPHAIALSTDALISLLFIYIIYINKLFLVFMCVSKMCNSNYGVCVFQRSCFVPISSLSTSVILFLIFFYYEMKRISLLKRG